MTEANNTAWDLIIEGAETMAKVGKVQKESSASGLNIDYDPLERSGTERRSVRVDESQMEWAEHLVELDIIDSRELLYKACIAFAQHNEAAFRNFALRCAVNGYQSLEEEPSNENLDSEDTTSEADTPIQENEEPQNHKQRRNEPKPENRENRRDRPNEQW